MRKQFSRRELLKVLAATASSIGLWKKVPLLSEASQSQQVLDEPTELTPRAYMPLISKPPAPAPAGVVHVHSSDATAWNGQTDYWNYVNQAAVDQMVDRGMMALTGASTVAAAWQSLLPDYSPGQGIAIKVNFNNANGTDDCNETDGQIDALMQPVNAIVRGLKQIGVRETDIWVYDAIRSIPARFINANQHPNVRFIDKFCREQASFSSNDPNAYISFNPPPGVTPPATRITDVIIDATYLINMPIMKAHSIAGVTLAFKNHFGTIEVPWPLHKHIDTDGSDYRSDYSPFVDIYQNPHIASKTILTIGDGLFAAKGLSSPPTRWDTFGDKVPNSLFFSTDPVAIDCVMCDFLGAEITIPDEADDYLRIASDTGLGVYERGDPWGSGYDLIDYLKIDL